MIAIPQTYIEDPDFNNDIDRLPPQNIEAEESILGGILIDPNALSRVKDWLKPEHFYIGAHKDIYQACIRLDKKGLPTDLIGVTSYLTDHDLLARIGGRNKLATLIDRTVSAVNIDSLARLVITKYLCREVIKRCNRATQLAYSPDQNITELLTLIRNQITEITDTPLAPTKEEYQRQRHDQLLSAVTNIYTTCPEPSFRYFRLHELAKERSVTTSYLENLYLKSLVAKCSELLTYEQLKELAGSTVREWLINGLVPKSTTILLAADGGIGKTKFAYGVSKVLIQGTQFGKFITTGKKRKILYYQGDESPGDMVQALEFLGYSESDIGKYVRARFGWSAENMPALITDLQEFQPDFVVIDSLSTANKYSSYQESQMEYARPILEMTGLATQYKTTFLIIHHTNRSGDVRGTTAIRNAVSEVWTLTKDNSQTATPYDRILEINKSRSRSSGKKYRLMFTPEDLKFTFLGEELEQGCSAAEEAAKDGLLEFFNKNRNIKFTAKELAHRLGRSDGYVRHCLGEIAADGLISVDRRPGQAYLYFLALEEPHDHPTITPDHPSKIPETVAETGLEPESEPCIMEYSITPRSPHDHPTITPDDHPIDQDTASDTAEGDRLSTEISEKFPEPDKDNLDFEHSDDHLCPEALPDNDSGGDREGDRGVIVADRDDHPPAAPEPPPLPPKTEIVEGQVYWSYSLCKWVKVVKRFPSKKKADVHVAGDPFNKPRLLWSDLWLEPPPLRIGEEVEVIEGQHKGQRLLVSSINGDDTVWLKKPPSRNGYSIPLSNNGQPYKLHQLKRG
ncbi:putative replicative DNA helicase [Nostoc sp. NIES-4103]|nr:putative replicative DNA helicase [Nostoc sp. NIES-4103]